MNLILNGIILGIGLSLTSATVSFTLLSVTIRYGKKMAYILLSQIIVTDIIIILILHLRVSVLSFKPWTNVEVNNLLAIAMCILGTYQILKKKKETDYILEKIFLKSIIMNLINPLIWLYWLGFLTIIHSKENSFLIGIFSFFIFVISELIKINYYYKSYNKASMYFLDYIEKIIGFIFLISGIKLLLFL